MVLFATYNNFLRPNSALDWKVPAEIPEIDRATCMPNKWIELLKVATKYAESYYE